VLPDHTQLPETDGSIVENFNEHPQTLILTDCIEPVCASCILTDICIGAHSGIYFRPADPPSRLAVLLIGLRAQCPRWPWRRVSSVDVMCRNCAAVIDVEIVPGTAKESMTAHR